MVSSLTSKDSRYVSGGSTEVNIRAIEWWDRRVFTVAADDSTYTVEKIVVGRLDLIATLHYNNPRYWWVIAQYNNILDPVAEVVEGLELVIPSLARVRALLDGTTGGVESTREVPTTVFPVV